MTYFETQAPIRKKLPAIVSGLALFLASALSIGGIHVLGFYVGFGFIPLLVLAIWPRRAATLLSFAFVFFAGLFTDWATGGITGQWALVFTVMWGWLRPELRSSPFTPMSLFLVWFASCGLALILLSISGWFVFRVFPDLASLGRQMLLATVLLPMFMLFRSLIASWFGERDDWAG